MVSVYFDASQQPQPHIPTHQYAPQRPYRQMAHLQQPHPHFAPQNCQQHIAPLAYFYGTPSAMATAAATPASGWGDAAGDLRGHAAAQTNTTAMMAANGLTLHPQFTTTAQMPHAGCSDTVSQSTNSAMEDKVCAMCGTRETPQWRRGEKGTKLCNSCGLKVRRVARQPRYPSRRIREGQLALLLAQGSSLKARVDREEHYRESGIHALPPTGRISNTLLRRVEVLLTNVIYHRQQSESRFQERTQQAKPLCAALQAHLQLQTWRETLTEEELAHRIAMLSLHEASLVDQYTGLQEQLAFFDRELDRELEEQQPRPRQASGGGPKNHLLNRLPGPMVIASTGGAAGEGESVGPSQQSLALLQGLGGATASASFADISSLHELTFDNFDLKELTPELLLYASQSQTSLSVPQMAPTATQVTPRVRPYVRPLRLTTPAAWEELCARQPEESGESVKASEELSTLSTSTSQIDPSPQLVRGRAAAGLENSEGESSEDETQTNSSWYVGLPAPSMSGTSMSIPSTPMSSRSSVSSASTRRGTKSKKKQKIDSLQELHRFVRDNNLPNVLCRKLEVQMQHQRTLQQTEAVRQQQQRPGQLPSSAFLPYLNDGGKVLSQRYPNPLPHPIPTPRHAVSSTVRQIEATQIGGVAVAASVVHHHVGVSSGDVGSGTHLMSNGMAQASPTAPPGTPVGLHSQGGWQYSTVAMQAQHHQYQQQYQQQLQQQQYQQYQQQLQYQQQQQQQSQQQFVGGGLAGMVGVGTMHGNGIPSHQHPAQQAIDSIVSVEDAAVVCKDEDAVVDSSLIFGDLPYCEGLFDDDVEVSGEMDVDWNNFEGDFGV